MAKCDKNHVFAAPLPACLREATERLRVEITRGRSKGEVATVDACDPCAGLVRLTTGLRVDESRPLEGGKG